MPPTRELIFVYPSNPDFLTRRKSHIQINKQHTDRLISNAQTRALWSTVGLMRSDEICNKAKGENSKMKRERSRDVNEASYGYSYFLTRDGRTEEREDKGETDWGIGARATRHDQDKKLGRGTDKSDR